MSGALTLASSPAASELLIASVLSTLTAEKTKQAHAAALEEWKTRPYRAHPALGETTARSLAGRE